MTRTLKKKKVRRYATGTKVSVDTSRVELEKLLAKNGATQRSITVDDDTGRAQVVFRLAGRMIRLQLKSERDCLPEPNKYEHKQDAECPRGWNNWSVTRREKWIEAQIEQCDREAWRRLLIVTKAKLEVIADDPGMIEHTFLADIMLPDGTTVYDGIRQRIAETYETGDMPKLLPAPEG